jgi:hypothetical protein
VWTIRKCFPTSGGEIIGNIIQRNRDDGVLNLMGGKTSGALLVLGGKDYEAGAVHLLARDETQASHLFQTATGKLYFIPDNINAPHALNDISAASIVASSISSNDSWYIKYANGRIIQGGIIALSTFTDSGVGSSRTFNLPISFPSGGMVAAFANVCSAGTSKDANAWACIQNGQSITIGCNLPSNAGYKVSWYAEGI